MERKKGQQIAKIPTKTAWGRALEQLRVDKKDVSVNQFERLGVMPRAAYRRTLHGIEGPTFANIEKLLKAMDCTWHDFAEALEGARRTAHKVEPDDLAMIPLLEFKAAAGGGGLIESERVLDELAFKRTWVKSKLRANPSALKLIKVTGDSMEPTLQHGDLVMFDTNQRTVKHGLIYVLEGEDGKLVKRLCLKHGGMVEIHSDNLDRRYHLPLAKPSELKILGRVVWVARMV